MSFYDDPVVDENSKRSEESVNAVKSLFTRKNGFISREEYPDYGVDLDVELILDGKNASSKKFPIQIKSTSKTKKLQFNGSEFISLEFKTSRLGYLAKRIPAYGIIILYDEILQVCYFDYVDEIIKRLDDDEARNSWREQEHVNISLPVIQLDIASLPAIHQKFAARHENNFLLIQKHGQRFGIPLVEHREKKDNKTIDFSDPVEVAYFLEEFGSLLFNEAEFTMISQLLDVISRERLNSSPQLVFLAAITYTQIGNVIDADCYLRRAKKIPSVMLGEGKGIIEFSELRIEFLKGNINYSSFLEKFKDIANHAKNTENKLTLQINILFFELAKAIENDEVATDFENQVNRLFEEINKADIKAEKKHLLKCYHADSQFHYALQCQTDLYAEIKIRDSLGVEMAMAARAKRIKRYIKLIVAAGQTVHEAYRFGREQKLPLLIATATHQLGRQFLAQHLNILFYQEADKVQQDKAYQIELFSQNQNYSIIAYGHFLNLNMFQNAHEALTTAYEINQLCIHLTGTPVGEKSPSELITIIRQIEENIDLNSFQSMIDEIIEKLKVENCLNPSSLKDKSDEELKEMAMLVLKGLDLPIDRLPNLLYDMNMYRTFEQKVTNPEIIMRQDIRHTQQLSTYYASLPKYILIHKSLGIETKPSSDINWLLNEFSTVLKKS